jgi:uncharacterized protein
MIPINKVVLIGLFLSLIAGCTTSQNSKPPEAPEQPQFPISILEHIVFSEIMTGAENNNNHDFIELYNPQIDAVDLNGYSLIYQLEPEADYITLHEWNSYTVLPPYGHYLLGYSGEDFGLTLDAQFKQNLLSSKGSLSLLNSAGEIQDSLCWGKQSCENSEGSPASAISKGKSLERLPGGLEGNATDTGDNAADFSLIAQPAPQNSGSTITPQVTSQMLIQLNVPETVNPGEEFAFLVAVSNPNNSAAENVEILLPIPEGLSIIDTQNTGTQIDPPFAKWDIPTLEANETKTLSLAVAAPWSYTDLVAHSYSVTTGNMPVAAIGGPTTIQVANGSVPIEIAKTLFEVDVVAEGIATMYTDGFYAGSSGTKFYLRDESGSVQVYVPGGKGSVNVNIGDRVRVQGHMELYRGALELIPASPDDVEVIAQNEAPPKPINVSIAEALQTESLVGELVTIQGNAARLEEFSYSSEMDLLDNTGQLITAYIDKETNATIETIENELLYTVIGILEIRDSNLQINPRQQTDIQEIPAETILVEIDPPSNVEQNEETEIAFTITNNQKDDVNNISFTMPLLPQHFKITDLSNNGEKAESEVVWQIPHLPTGESITISATVQIISDQPFFEIKDYTLTADNSPAIVAEIPHNIFTSPNLPIWAIQGPGARSPYLMEIVQTQGVITAMFPDMNGFWLQETKTDENPATSAGIFVSTEGLSLEVATGDQIELNALVREVYQQTQLTPTSKNDVIIIKSGIRLPTPISLDPPQSNAEAEVYYEALEGMLVDVPGTALAVSPINKYGELTLVLPKHGLDRLYQDQQNGFKIFLDDGSNETHLDQSTLPFIVNTGDSLSNITGPLEFTYGNYKVALTSTPRIKPQPIELAQLPEIHPGQFSVMTWNVENLFDYLEPHPSSPSLPNIRQYKVDIARCANTILAAGAPSVVAMQEVENIKALEDITHSEILNNYSYLPVLIEGTDSRGIDVGYLVRNDHADLLDTKQYEAPEGITSRPPLEIVLETVTPQTTLHILNNHFTSMSGGEKATEPRRNSQAAWNVTVMEQILDADPSSNIIITGDLNSYYASPPIEILRDAGLSHAFDQIQPEERYTYIYEGASQTLDHILMTEWLYEVIDSVNVLHINADFTLPIAGDESPTRKSDHDPVIVIFNLSE